MVKERVTIFNKYSDKYHLFDKTSAATSANVKKYAMNNDSNNRENFRSTAVSSLSPFVYILQKNN